MAALNYARFPGPGDLPGDSRSPNSPDYVEPAFSREDASFGVADRLHKAREDGYLLEAVANASPALEWLANNAELPALMRADFAHLVGESARIARMVDAEWDALNAPERAA